MKEVPRPVPRHMAKEIAMTKNARVIVLSQAQMRRAALVNLFLISSLMAGFGILTTQKFKDGLIVMSNSITAELESFDVAAQRATERGDLHVRSWLNSR